MIRTINMKSELPGEDCFICCTKSVGFCNKSGSEQDICHIICQHFWFNEDDLRSAIVCEICWEKVDRFHQFYVYVQNLHGQIEPSVFIKQEEIEIEEDQLPVNCIDLPVEDQKPIVGDGQIEAPEVCNEVKQLNQEPRKKRKYTRRPSSERMARNKNPRPRRLLTPEERQAEDDFIKQHTFYFCEECSMEFENFRAFKRHQIKTHNKDAVVCCGTQHRTRSMLYQHVQHVLNPEAFKCEICSYTFKYHSGYLRHRKVHHTVIQESIFKCHRCNKSFAKKEALRRHMMGHETLDNETAKCEICGKCFGHKRLLKVHVNTVHKKPTNFICEICSKAFYRRASFLVHLKRHELSTDHPRKQCPVCNKLLKKFSYWRHVRRHEEDGKEYKCEKCAHVSINLMALKIHVKRKHAPDRKSHVCELCGKEYSRPTTLREHIANAHTGEPLYHCQYCEKKFFSLATICNHRKKKHPQEWQEEQLAKYAPAKSSEGVLGELIS